MKLSLSLSLCIYIYIYIYIHTGPTETSREAGNWVRESRRSAVALLSAAEYVVVLFRC